MLPNRRQIPGAGFGRAVTLTALAAHSQEAPMYGLIGKMTATPGNRDELAAAPSSPASATATRPGPSAAWACPGEACFGGCALAND